MMIQKRSHLRVSGTGKDVWKGWEKLGGEQWGVCSPLFPQALKKPKERLLSPNKGGSDVISQKKKGSSENAKQVELGAMGKENCDNTGNT